MLVFRTVISCQVIEDDYLGEGRNKYHDISKCEAICFTNSSNHKMIRDLHRFFFYMANTVSIKSVLLGGKVQGMK